MGLLEKLKKGTENKRTIKYPGTSEDIVMSVLAEGARQDAQFATEHLFKSKDVEVSMSTVDAYEAEKTLQMLYRALTDTEGKPLTLSVDEFRRLITVEEKNILVDEYVVFEKECAPNPEVMSEEELENLFEEIKKKPQILGRYSNIAIARQLIAYLANRPTPSLPGSGSIS